MKKITLLITVFAFILQSHAQEEIPKELLLSGLNSVAHLKLDNDQVIELIEYNKGFVDEIYEVLESDKEDKSKKKSMKILSEKRENDLREFLGKHKTNKYLKLMEDELRPLSRRNHAPNLFNSLPVLMCCPNNNSPEIWI